MIFLRRLQWRGVAAFVCALALALILPSPAAHACPRSDALAPKNAKTQYRQREDRCEGIYATPVSTTSRPRIVGFHRKAFPGVAFSTIPSTSLSLLVGSQSRPVSIRAISLRPRTYYAMDTDLAAGRSGFSWKTSILSSPELALRANELGVLACDNMCLPQATTSYFPVELAIPASPAQAVGYVLIFQSDVSIERAAVTLQDASGATVLQRQLNGRYVGSWPITAAIGQPRAGTYRVRLTAEASDGTRLNAAYSIVIP